mmetsp:Transcript_72152/g.165522  ORF Transcript_72152/g.165522 Transcript_72152/m.165522 type:complete len:89 (+) Transcript_72152:2050-2316(+)
MHSFRRSWELVMRGSILMAGGVGVGSVVLSALLTPRLGSAGKCSGLIQLFLDIYLCLPLVAAGRLFCALVVGACWSWLACASRVDSHA